MIPPFVFLLEFCDGTGYLFSPLNPTYTVGRNRILAQLGLFVLVPLGGPLPFALGGLLDRSRRPSPLPRLSKCPRIPLLLPRGTTRRVRPHP